MIRDWSRTLIVLGLLVAAWFCAATAFFGCAQIESIVDERAMQVATWHAAGLFGVAFMRPSLREAVLVAAASVLASVLLLSIALLSDVCVTPPKAWLFIITASAGAWVIARRNRHD